MTHEPNIKFPDNPFEAGIVYYAVMAYPEKGAGQIGSAGSEFADAIVKFTLWACKQARGLNYLRDQTQNTKFLAPQKCQFMGRLELGMRRVARRFSAYDIVGTQALQGFFGASEIANKAKRGGKYDQLFYDGLPGSPRPMKFEYLEKATPSAFEIIGQSPEHWSDRLTVNQVGQAADQTQKMKDINRRMFKPSIPVLHMAHGLSMCMHEHGKKIEGWTDREPLTAMLLNASLWIEDAIQLAEEWRISTPFLPGQTFKANNFIQLER